MQCEGELIETQECKKCNKILPLDQFSKQGFNPEVNFSSHSTSKSKLSLTCKSCCSTWQREYRKKKKLEDPDYFKRPRVKLTQEEKLLNSFIGQRLHDAKGRSTKYGKPFNITKEYLKELWNGKCAITGFELPFIKGSPDVGSLDCIIPKLGYVLGNVQWLSWRVNRAKGDLTNEQFVDMCKAVIKSATTIENTP